MRHLLILLAVSVLAGCAGGNVRDDEPKQFPVYGTQVEKPTGPDGVVITEHERQRRIYETNMRDKLGLLAKNPDLIIEEHINRPTKRPTVQVKYDQKPPKAGSLDFGLIDVYRHKRIDGDTVIYSSDLGQMAMVMERRVKGKVYEYREITTVVPYGFCIDFIEQNLGKESEGYLLRKITCNQDNLGHDY